MMKIETRDANVAFMKWASDNTIPMVIAGCTVAMAEQAFMAGFAAAFPPMICECGDHINPAGDYAHVNGKYLCTICMQNK